ncbi:hypothetical protein FPC831_1050002 [Flavobacterium psychrophilum]|nr:hypothetical protein FPC831_1050002 [Flavobacterium psychrophilum]
MCVWSKIASFFHFMSFLMIAFKDVFMFDAFIILYFCKKHTRYA